MAGWDIGGCNVCVRDVYTQLRKYHLRRRRKSMRTRRWPSDVRGVHKGRQQWPPSPCLGGCRWLQLDLLNPFKAISCHPDCSHLLCSARNKSRYWFPFLLSQAPNVYPGDISILKHMMQNGFSEAAFSFFLVQKWADRNHTNFKKGKC